MTLPITPSQTIGPFSHEAWNWAFGAGEPATATLTISGIIRDGDGVAINDAIIEAWAPDAAHFEPGARLPGFRRVPSGDDGVFSFTLPRASAASGEPAALITVFARGLLLHQFSAVFLDDDSSLAASVILNQVVEARRPTLVAKKTADGTYSWDIWLQGPEETVFFDHAGAP